MHEQLAYISERLKKLGVVYERWSTVTYALREHIARGQTDVKAIEVLNALTKLVDES
jgi:hypothetical protein